MTSVAPIAILGGSGFIGTRLALRMEELGHEIRIGDLNPSETHANFHTTCDVREANSLIGVLAGANTIINLAAEHRDDVRPISRYYETNVEGARQVCGAATKAGISRIIFTSSVAVYGFQTHPMVEEGPFLPFNPYGQTKLEAEGVYREWAEEDPNRSLVIIRPTVVFGEGNRGNVYNLLRQLASGRFMMVGQGTNKKSLAYVGNVADFLVYSLSFGPGIHIFNYADGPDMNMNDLVALVNRSLDRSISRWRIPLAVAMAGGHFLDVLARLTGRRFPISAIRVKKFCENTQVSADRVYTTGFKARYSLVQALEQTIKKELELDFSDIAVKRENN